MHQKEQVHWDASATNQLCEWCTRTATAIDSHLRLRVTTKLASNNCSWQSFPMHVMPAPTCNCINTSSQKSNRNTTASPPTQQG